MLLSSHARQVLEKWVPKLMGNAEAMRTMQKADRLWMAKAVYFGAITGPKSKIPHHGKKELLNILWERYQATSAQLMWGWSLSPGGVWPYRRCHYGPCVRKFAFACAFVF